MQEMISAFFAGDGDTAALIHKELMPVFKVIFLTTNPIPIKTACQSNRPKSRSFPVANDSRY